MTQTERELRDTRRILRDLVVAVEQHIAHLDRLGKMPESVERGKMLARLTNALELGNEMARRFGLGKLSARKRVPEGKEGT